MNLRYSPTLLALVLAISAAGARRTGGHVVLGSGLTKLLTSHQDDGNEKSTNRRRAGSISASVIERATVDGRSYYPDVGVLQGGKSRRRLGGSGQHADSIEGAYAAGLRLRFLEAEAVLKCGTNGTCAPSVCYHLANWHNVYTSAAAFNSICNGYMDTNGRNWTLEGCVGNYPETPNYQMYSMKGICPLAKCVDEGGTYGSCYCQLYNAMCKMYGDERPYVVS